MATLKDKTLFITGGSRGIGRAIALRAARDGAQLVIVAKTDSPHPKLAGTIHTVAKEIEQAGGKALPIKVDIRDEAQISGAVEQAMSYFGGIDILVNNASAITLSGTLEIPLKQFDLMMSVNVRGTFACSQACIPHLKKSANPHILNLSPPLSLQAKWFKNHTAYTISKYGMSMCMLGMAEEFKEDGIAVNALWPRTVIATAALTMLGSEVPSKNCRKPEIVADAAHVILTRDSSACTGCFFIDEEVLAEIGVKDFDQYAHTSGEPLLSDLFVEA